MRSSSSIIARLVRSSSGGYVFLISVLFIGAIAAATSVSMVLLGLAAQQDGAALLESVQAEEYAQMCVERSLRSLRSDPTYIGNQTFTFLHGSCTVQPIGGALNESRTICVEGDSGVSKRRLQVRVKRLLPTTLIESWQETLEFTFCS